MSHNTEISIVVPVWNEENRVTECLISLKNQDFNNFEVIIIDDGSTDNSRNVIEKFIEDDDRFQYFLKDHSGIGKTLNAGFGSPDYSFCPYMNMTTYIGGDQNVYTCCVNAYNERGLVGSIKDQSFMDLWNGQTKKQFFGQFDAKNCLRCMFNEKNRFINGVIRKPNVHDDFV